MLKGIAIAVAAVILAVLGLAATRSDEFRIERTALIKASPERIYPLISDFREWPRWSPWERVDPAMKRALSGAPSGVGAVYAWDGDRNVGNGRMEIVEATPPSRVAVKLDFETPFEGHNTAEFSLRPAGDATSVTWAMYGRQGFMGRLFGLFMNMDRMVGGQFEKGLADLKAHTEKSAS